MPIKETISASEWAVVNLEIMERMIGIIVSTGTVIKDNETNEIIHEIENEDKEICLYSFAEEKMKFNIHYFLYNNCSDYNSDFRFYRKFFFLRISGCLAKCFEI